MATGKRYYWIKLKDSFMSSDEIDYLMSQPDGANYVVLYQMLCLKTINTNGCLVSKIGEMLIPYDAEKIQRECKWFPLSTVRLALTVYKQIGLIFENPDGTLSISDYQNMIGSETDWAAKNRRIRSNDLVWHFDDVVPRSQEFDKAKGIDGWNAGLLTKDEARELLGMEPCKTGGDCFKITISDMFIGSNDDPAEVTTDLMQESTDGVEVTDDEDTGGMLSMSDRREHEEKSRVQNIGNLLVAAQKAQRAKFEVATMKFFRQQQKRLSGSLSGTEKADWSVWDVLMPYITENHVEDSAAWSALGEQEQKNLVEQFIGGLVNWPSEETAMEEIFKPLWKQTYDEGTRIAKQAYNIRGVDRPELLSQAKLHGGKRVRRVTQTTKENISRIVANGIEAGIGREKMADEILQEYEIQTRSRARLIADQETVMTLETGHYDMMQKSGATTKTWHHRPQKNPRDGSDGGPNHVKMDGETVPIDARFSNGLRYPCDPEGPARETIKCRCYVTYNR